MLGLLNLLFCKTGRNHSSSGQGIMQPPSMASSAQQGQQGRARARGWSVGRCCCRGNGGVQVAAVWALLAPKEHTGTLRPPPRPPCCPLLAPARSWDALEAINRQTHVSSAPRPQDGAWVPATRRYAGVKQFELPPEPGGAPRRLNTHVRQTKDTLMPQPPGAHQS